MCLDIQYVVIIEDKTHSSEHDDQLKRYKDTIHSDYPEAEIVCAYYKTGFQSNYSEVDKAGYRVLGRRRILALLGQYADRTDNDIFRDYYAYWKNYEDIACGYKDLSIIKWDDGRHDRLMASMSTHRMN